VNITEERLTQAILEYDDALMASLPDPSECIYEFSNSFERKMKKLIRKADHYVAYKIMRYAASILIAFILSVSLLLSFNAEVRASVVNWIREHAYGVYNYFFTAEEADRSSEYVLGWVPEDYVLDDSFVHAFGKNIQFVDSEGNVLLFAYMKGSDTISFTAGEGKYVEKMIIDGNFYAELYISTKEDISNFIVWRNKNEELIFTISAFENEDTLIKMAKNVITK